MNPEKIPCPDGSMADPAIGCVTPPASVVNAESGLLKILLNMAGGLMALVIIVATITLIHGSLHYIMHAGNEEEAEKAKTMIVWSLGGLVLALISKPLVNALLTIVS